MPDQIQTEPESLSSFEEAQRRLGKVSRKMIYRLIEQGKLRSVTIGSRRMIRTADILALIEGTSPTND